MTKRIGLMSLIGETLSGVCFVMDYVEFHFDGAIVRALNYPILETRGVATTFGEPGSRDALCSAIGTLVEAVAIREKEAIEMRLSSGQVLRIPLDEGSMLGPEAAHFVPGPDQPIEVW